MSKSFLFTDIDKQFKYPYTLTIRSADTAFLQGDPEMKDYIYTIEGVDILVEQKSLDKGIEDQARRLQAYYAGICTSPYSLQGPYGKVSGKDLI